MKEKIVYQLTTEDLQNVANEVLDRKLSQIEIELIAEKLGDFINWYDSIEDAINIVLKRNP